MNSGDGARSESVQEPVIRHVFETLAFSMKIALIFILSCFLCMVLVWQVKFQVNSIMLGR